MLEQLAGQHRSCSLTFHDLLGSGVGVMTLDGGMVRFGVQVEGRPYLDQAFEKEAAAHATLLRKLQNDPSLTAAELQLLRDMPPTARSALRGVTARAIERIARLSDLCQVTVGAAPAPRLPHNRLIYHFPLVELMLALGRTGGLAPADPAVQIYQQPPFGMKEGWLFQWQTGDRSCPWPVMTTRMGERRINAVVQFGQLGQLLARHRTLRLPLFRAAPHRPSAFILSSDAHVYYAICSARYLALLVADGAALGRLCEHMELLLRSAAAAPEPQGAEEAEGAEEATAEPDAAPPDAAAPAVWRELASAAAPAAPPERPCGPGPRGFQWLRPGELAGLPAPGLTNEIDYDLELIRGAGVSWLVTLTRERLPAAAARAHGLQVIYFPLRDMDAPGCAATAELCARVAALQAAGSAVGFYCKAGRGRTGTMLAAFLIWEGCDVPSALRQVRAIDPQWVQSPRQLDFLDRFAAWLAPPLRTPEAASSDDTEAGR